MADQIATITRIAVTEDTEGLDTIEIEIHPRGAPEAVTLFRSCANGVMWAQHTFPLVDIHVYRRSEPKYRDTILGKDN